MNLRIPLKPVQGYNKIFDIGEYKMELTNFGLIKLAKGTTYEGDSAETEVALVLIGGNFSAKVSAFHGNAPTGCGCSSENCTAESTVFEVTDGRKSPFTGKPYCLYLPRHTKYVVTALSDVELAFQSAPVTRDTAKPTLIRPADTHHLDIGRDNFFRTSEVILDETFDSENFYIGEGMIPNGNWSGYPSHRHDVNNPPAELDMEETYFYLFDKAGEKAGEPNQGFGFQAVYTPEGVVAKKFGERLNEGYRVSSYDTVAIAEGYHPLVGAPGYNMYYLWTMAGKQGRGLKSSMDPAHTWVVGK